MKKILTFVLPILIVAALVYVYKNSSFERKILGSFSETQEESIHKNDFEIPFKDETFKVHWFEVNPEKLILIPNFEKPLTAREASIEYSCSKLANGGFYSKENSPIGLFMNDEGILSPFQKNNLFNGVVSVNALETPRITRIQPKDVLRIGLQTGPILKENAQFLTLSSSEDIARRTIAFTTGENKLYFAIIYDPKSSFIGPTLSDLPLVLEKFEEESGIVIADAVNLDGGSTSSFIDGDFSMSEISFSGSFFCEQE